jgi:hypothetical protein
MECITFDVPLNVTNALQGQLAVLPNLNMFSIFSMHFNHTQTFLSIHKQKSRFFINIIAQIK